MMNTTTSTLLLSFALLGDALAAPARHPGYAGAHDCKIASVEPAPRKDVVEWNGACKDGFANGPGTLVWTDEQGKRRTLKGSLARGELQGEGELTTPGYTYSGTLRRGVPHGNGYLESEDGDQYEGGFANNEFDGKGILLTAFRTEYKGEWKNGKMNGSGEATFALGGSYVGQWKDNRPHGNGIMIFAGSGRKFEGRFEHGVPAGLTVPAAESRHSILKSRREGELVAPGSLDATWETLGEGERNTIRQQYHGLEFGDDPPYPLGGTRKVYEAVMKLNKNAGAADGGLLIRIMVGTDGKAIQAEVLRKPTLDDPEDAELLAKYVASVMMLDRYKPAMCRGAPCPMAYAASFRFTSSPASGFDPPMFR